MEQEMLIESVHRHCISLLHYRNSAKKETVWRSISDEVGQPGKKFILYVY